AEAENFTDAAQPGDKHSSAEVLVRLLIADGTAKNRADAQAHLAALSHADVTRYLHSKSSAAVMAAYKPWPGNGMLDMPKVFSDASVLPDGERLHALADPDGHNAVAVMLGTNKDENKLFMFVDPQQVRRYLWFVPRLRDERMYNLSAQYLSAMWKA